MGDTGSEDTSSFPWGTIVGVMCTIVGFCGCLWMGNRFYQKHADNLASGGGGGMAGMAKLFGAPGNTSDRKEKEGGDEEDGEGKDDKDKGANTSEKKDSGGDGNGKSAGGGGEGGGTKGSAPKSMTVGGVRINFT